MAKQSNNKFKYDISSQPLSLKYAVFCIVDMVGLFPVIALPRAIINCGWLGIPLAFTVFLLEIYTAILLGRCWILAEYLDKDITKKKRSPYGGLVELAFGKSMSTYVTVILDLSIFGACIPDVLIAAQNLQVIGLKVSRYETDISYCYWLLVLGVAITPIMWLGSPKDMKLIGVTSVSIVFLTSLLTWSTILTVKTEVINIPEPSWEAVGIAYGTLAFQFDVHPMILSVQMDMNNKHDIGKAIIIAFLVSGGLFTVTMVLCYSMLGDSVQYNTLQSLPQSPVLDVALFLSTLQVCLSMAVGSTTFFQDVEDSLHLPPEFGWHRVVFRSGLVLLAVAIGEAVPRFDLLMGLVGGAFTSQLIFLFPPLLYRRLRSMQPPFRTDLRKYGKNERFLLTWVPPVGEQTRHLYGTFGIEEVVLLSASVPEVDLKLKRISQEAVFPYKHGGKVEDMILVIVPLIGVAATCTAAFFSIRETIEFAEYAPSCLLNYTFPAQYLAN